MLVANGIAPARRVNAGNFTMAEDGFLAHAFVIVSTNAAVGTDQDGKMFWTKITEDFVRRGGGPSRTSNSLKTRFNRTLQHDVNKYIGHLQGALREHHSGWVIADYTNKANDNFERVEGTCMCCFCDMCCVKFLRLLPSNTNTQLTFCWFYTNRKKMEARSCLRDSSARIAKVRARYPNHASQSFECFVPFGLRQDESGKWQR